MTNPKTIDQLIQELPEMWRGDARALGEELDQDAARQKLEAAVELVHAARAELLSKNRSSRKLLEAAYLLSNRELPSRG
jgi:hypothetical protein